MVTPFAEDGSVDEAAARSLARRLLDNGSHGLVVAGTTGEGATLTDAEQISLLEAIVDEAGDDALIVCGSGTNDTRHSQELSKAAEAAGADALLVVTPYYNKPNRAGLLGHFGAVAGSVKLPVILYNIPSRSVINLPPDLLAELAQIDNIVAVKQANNEELGPVEGLDILAGNDDVFFRTLELGGTGGICVASHLVGNEMRELYEAAKVGDLAGAREIDTKLQPFFEALAVTTNPIPVKAGLELLGICSARARLPIVEADDEQRDVVRKALEAQGLLSAATSG
ncbi:MAG: 4-hydroxy-tetrahydrodipicolinate synthase [Solirubrobacterales bacterium]|nr:4-hydroxy-tetrahydrodipicolinate synthase [Solirubrobacterales bacterium]